MTKDFPERFQCHCNAVITAIWANLYTSYRKIHDVHWIVYHDQRKITCRTIDSFRNVWIRFRNQRKHIDGIEMRIIVYDNLYGRTWESITDVTGLFQVGVNMESEEVIECLKILLDSVKSMGKHTKIEGCNSDSVEYVLKQAIELIEWHESEDN